MASDLTTPKEDALESENAGLRELIAQAGIDAARLLAQAGIDATEQKAAERLQRLLLEELHHRVKNTVATVMAITSQTLRSAENLAQGRQAIDSRLLALGTASLSAIGYEHTTAEPAVLFWNDDRHLIDCQSRGL